MFISASLILYFFPIGVNIMKFVFLVFNESLLVLNHVENLCSWIFTSWIRVLKHVCEWNRLVSSANSLGFIISETCSMSFIYKTSWIPGFARDPLSRSLSPSLSRPSLPSLLFVPAFYPPSLGLPGFAQDNCIPEILFKPWSLVTLKCSPLPPPRRMGWGGGYMFWLFFRQNFFCLSIFSAVREISRTFDPQTPPPPGRWTPRGGVGKNLFYWFSGHSWVSLTLVDWRQRKRRHYVYGLIVTSFATQRLAEEAGSPSDPTLPGHSWGQYLVGTIPRSIRICVPNLVMIGLAVWPPILDRHTDRICII